MSEFLVISQILIHFVPGTQIASLLPPLGNAFLQESGSIIGRFSAPCAFSFSGDAPSNHYFSSRRKTCSLLAFLGTTLEFRRVYIETAHMKVAPGNTVNIVWIWAVYRCYQVLTPSLSYDNVSSSFPLLVYAGQMTLEPMIATSPVPAMPLTLQSAPPSLIISSCAPMIIPHVVPIVS